MILLILFLPNSAFTQSTWTQMSDFPGEYRYSAATFSIGIKGYISVAYSAGDYYLNDLWEWDQTTNLWTRKADCPGKPGGFGISFSIGTKGYLGGGYDRTSIDFTNEFWEYDSETNSWTQKASLPDYFFSGTSFSIGTKGYCLNYQGLWEWDQTTNEWTKKSDYPGKGYDVSFSIGNKGYIGIGYDYVSQSYINEFWEWDQETNIWTRKADFGGTSRMEAVGFSIGNKGYIGTGLSNVNTSMNTYNDLWEWDQTTNVWTKKADFGGPTRRSANSFSIGNKAYIGLGTTGSTDKFYMDFWEFYPSAITGLEEMSTENNFFYPNPATDIITLKTSITDNPDQILNIYNISGVLISSATIQQDRLDIDISSLSNGIYIIEVKSKGGLEKQKLIVQK